MLEDKVMSLQNEKNELDNENSILSLRVQELQVQNNELNISLYYLQQEIYKWSTMCYYKYKNLYLYNDCLILVYFFNFFLTHFLQ